MITTKGQQYERVRFQHEYSKFVRHSNAELEQLERCYSENLVTRDTQAQEIIWTSVCKLYHLIFEEGWSLFRRKKVLKELYDRFFRLEINRRISRPNFDVCVKLCCCDCQPGSAKERCILLASEDVFNAFDTLSKGMINWRQFIFYLHLLSEPALSCEEQLKKAFIIISSSTDDGLEYYYASSASSSTKHQPTLAIDLQDLASILFPLIKISALETVLNALDEAWAEVVTKCGANNKTKLSLHLFEKMLNQRVIQSFFAGSRSLAWGKGDYFKVFVCHWEAELYNAELLSIIRNSRRDHAIRDKLVRDDNRKRRQVCKCWLERTRYQISQRKSFDSMNRMFVVHQLFHGYIALCSWRTKHNSACDIQRVGRGFLGKIKAKIQFMMKESAILIQTHFRIYLARRTFQQLLSRYLSAVVKVQCLFRGTLARRLALKKLMTLVEKQRSENEQEMARYAFERGIWSLTRLQSHRRRHIAILEVNRLRQKRQREIEVRHAMESRSAAFRRERKLYQRQLEAYYQQMKDDHDTNQKNEAKIRQDNIRLRTLQRRLKNDELKSQEPDIEMEEKLATEEWKQGWLTKIEKDIVKAKEYYVSCLDRPASKREKKNRAVAKKRIKERVAVVLRRADAKNIPMEIKEAKVIAREEVVYMVGEEERNRLLEQMDKAFIKRENDKEKTRIQVETAKRDAHARATVYAVSVVASACRRWLARREMRRLCLERYEKRYDENHHTFYYLNKVTGETRWTKPEAMGMLDIPVKDEWVVLRDIHNFPYYFNPSTYDIKWNPPLNVEVCGGTVLQTWWREYPVKTGGCPNLACCLNEDDGIRYCQECFDRKVQNNYGEDDTC
ncbi:hypothetical protein ACHAWC_011521 [Mediolabrus comicus]